jgi:hypothetical protein
VKHEFTPVLLSREDDDAAAPIKDDGRDGNGESGLTVCFVKLFLFIHPLAQAVRKFDADTYYFV